MSIINKIEIKIKSYITTLSEAQKYTFFSAIIFGFMAHGYAFFNRLSVHDNSHCLFSLGSTYEVNRWGLGIIYDLQVLSTKTFSLPVFNGILSILLISISAMMIIKIFDIKSKLLGLFVGSLMVTFPMVTSSFSFMFTTWPYFLGLLIIIMAAYIGTQKLSIKNILASAVVLAVGLSFYQAFLGVIITIYLMKLFLDTVEMKIKYLTEYIKEGVLYLVNLILGLTIWAAIAKLFRIVRNIELLSYKGWNEGYDISQLPNKLTEAIFNFLTFRMEGINSLRYLRALSLIVFMSAVIIMIILLLKSKSCKSTRIGAAIGALLLPVGMMVVYLLSTSELYQVSTMMLYPEVFVYIIPLILIEHTGDIKNRLVEKINQIITLVVLSCTLVVTIGYVYLDNAAYYKASLYQEQAVVYMTALLANIKSTEGFSDDKDIVFVGFNSIEDATINEVASKEEMDGIQLEKYYNSLEEMLNYGVNIQFMRDHLGIGNEHMYTDDNDEIAALPEVKKMPVYPNKGGIAIIDHMVVVKMGNIE